MGELLTKQGVDEKLMELPKIPFRENVWNRVESWWGAKNSGRVVGVVADKDLGSVTVYYDGGRRVWGNGNEILLEGVELSAEEVVEGGVSRGDRVEVVPHSHRVVVLASVKKLAEQGVYVPELKTDWDRVVGVVVRSRFKGLSVQMRVGWD